MSLQVTRPIRPNDMNPLLTPQTPGDCGGRSGEVVEADSGIGTSRKVEAIERCESTLPQGRRRLHRGHEVRAAVEAEHPDRLI